MARLALPGRGSPDLGAVDAVARLALAARRRGFSIRVDAAPELAAVLALAGLDAEVVGLEVAGLGGLGLEGLGLEVSGLDQWGLGPRGLGVQVAGQAEGGVEAGVEEVVVTDDPAV